MNANDAMQVRRKAPRATVKATRRARVDLIF
jgi:hypothetical protein